MEWISWEEQTTLRFLGTVNPSIGKYPHCLMRSTRENLEIVLDQVSDIPLWYGAGPLWSYLEQNPKAFAKLSERFPDIEMLDDFVCTDEARRLWLRPELQEFLKDNIGGYDANFSFAYPSSVSHHLLDRVPLMNETVYHPNGEIHYLSEPTNETYLQESLPKWIEDIGWAYISFGCEVNYAVFVTGHHRVALCDAVKEALTRTGERIAVLEPGVDRFHWRWLS
jgi:hypothetical protein